MCMNDQNTEQHQPQVCVQDDSRMFSRRNFLIGGAATVAGAAAMLGVDAYAQHRESMERTVAFEEAGYLRGRQTIPFYGYHQAGIEMIPQAHQSLVSLRLHPETDREALKRMFILLTEDASRLTQGFHALADSEPELANVPSRLTITFGFGRGLVERVNPGASPDWLQDLPVFQQDALQTEWNGGDLVFQIASDDALSVAHAQRMLLKDSRRFASLAWVQQGFRSAYGSDHPGRVQRNLFGQVDGTVNMVPESEDFRQVVWEGAYSNPPWLEGGCGFVVRRIEMLLDKWDGLDRNGREQAVGRRLDSGAPLTGRYETDEPDFDAVGPMGFPVIPEFSHMRRARSDDTRERIYRRGYNYDVHPVGEQISSSGLIFTSYQHNVAKQFLPLQQRLSELDLLNEWIAHIGSAVFAMPPGCTEGQFIGQQLFEA